MGALWAVVRSWLALPGLVYALWRLRHLPRPEERPNGRPATSGDAA